MFTCTGGSKVGQLANAADRKLITQGYGRMSCLAGITASIRGIALVDISTYALVCLAT
ncbi:MAG: putative zinc-binding protein [Methanothrix sp.]|nr:putative zinc-binding protein [Methanothrix sp.]MCX8207162.1 putative zinc-binding protein [Methanothrix sp.]